MLAVFATLTWSASAFAQLDDELPDDEDVAPSSPDETSPAPEPETTPVPSSAPSPEEAAAAGSTSVSVGANTSASSEASSGASAPDTSVSKIDETKPNAPVRTSDQDEKNPVRTGSNIRRPVLMPDGALVIDGPLATDVQGRDWLQTRRQLGGIALPDTTAALGESGPGTLPGGSGFSALDLRLQPTLYLLNGHRLSPAPFFGPNGADFFDINQIPIQMIERVEIVRGNVAGVYGDGAIGGAVNFVTRRNFKGVEVEVGGATTDKFDQHDEDVALTLGAGDEDNGITSMVSYFNRSSLAATDRDWIKDRDARVNQLLSSPSSFQPLNNFQYPFPDPYCNIASKAGHADGLQVRIKGYGPPETLGLLPEDVRMNILNTYDRARGNGDGVLDPLETSTYCSGNFTRDQDLVIKDERIQTYNTFWHKFSDHTEGYGELGYYRSENSNRTAPSFPVIRLTPDVNNIEPVWVPADHADQPVQARGFAAAEVQMGRVPQNQFIVGRVIGTYAGPGQNKRRTDVYRGVLGVRGDLKSAGAGSILETWDWDVSGVYTGSESVSSVQDVLMDKLANALNACSSTRMDGRNTLPTTIKDRQQAGCFNPFYSSVTNNAAIDPLNVSKQRAPSSRGFVTTDTDAMGKTGHGVQDGGYICDPNDPNSPPCPAEFDIDPNHPGFELAGTPNTKQVIDRLLGDQITVQRRTLGTADATLRGDLAHFAGGGLGFGLGGQFRRETMSADYDAAYNQRLYGFLFGGPDVPNVGRNIAAGYAELRLRLLEGAIEVQPAARVEHYQNVGTALDPMAGLALRPFAASATPPAALEWLLLRGHIGRGNRAPSLLQMYGTQNQFEDVDFFGSTLFVPHQVAGNPNLDFEKYTTISGGLQWDFVGIHIGADFWTTEIKDLIGADNTKTLAHDCEVQYMNSRTGDCHEVVLLTGLRNLDHFESAFANIADVSTNGVDGGASYTLDSKKRGLGDFGTFVIGVQGQFINSYLIKSPRGLREYYRTGTNKEPVYNADGTRDYGNVHAEYEAAGYRNLDNFAPPIPRLRFAVPLRWAFGQHLLGVTMRYISGYNDDSEWTVERYGLAGINDLANAPGEAIPAWTVFDANYGFTFGDELRKVRLAIGVINILDTPPPAVESPLGYEVGIHDPRGRIVYARATGTF